MTPGEHPDFLGDALRLVQPKDKTQREKLERLKVLAQKNREATNLDLAKFEKQMTSLLDPEARDKQRAEAEERSRLVKEYEDRFDTALDEQIDLLSRIATATGSRGSS